LSKSDRLLFALRTDAGADPASNFRVVAISIIFGSQVS